jgi:hypothetical protein
MLLGLVVSETGVAMRAYGSDLIFLLVETWTPTTNISYYKEGRTSSRDGESKSSRPCGASAAIKQQVSTPLVRRPLCTLPPEHVLMLHRTHRFILNMQPSFPAAAVPVRAENINRIVPAAHRLAVMVEHSIQLVMHWFCGLSDTGYHDV